MSVTSAQTVDLDAQSQQLHARAGHLEAQLYAVRQASYSLQPEWQWRIQGVLTECEQLAARVRLLGQATASTSSQLTESERSIEASMGNLSTGFVWLISQAMPFLVSHSTRATASLGVKTALVETPVSVTPVLEYESAPPRTTEELISRIPRPGEGGEQIRIEKYGLEHPVYYVYLGGTMDSGLSARGEPWDMTSNVEAMAARDAGSQRAAVEAMRQAGIEADDEVIIVGHSQGGLVAARIAESEQFRVTSLVTVGAPIHKIEVPTTTQVLAIEHREDVIPMLSGIAAAGTLATTLTVRRSVAGIPGVPGDALPAHNLARYVETAREVDRTSDPRLREAVGRATEPGRAAAQGQGSTTGQVSTWRADRQ
jgi:pimeloyl-ACP methyl ester carboxylesterase